MRNFVAKNAFNKASTHRDKKNDYTRQWDLEEEMEEYESFTYFRRITKGCNSDDSQEDS